MLAEAKRGCKLRLKIQGGKRAVHVCTRDCTQNQNWFSRYCSRSDVFIRSTGSFQSDPNISLALSILFRIVLICTNIASAVTEKFILFSRSILNVFKSSLPLSSPAAALYLPSDRFEHYGSNHRESHPPHWCTDCYQERKHSAKNYDRWTYRCDRRASHGILHLYLSETHLLSRITCLP